MGKFECITPWSERKNSHLWKKAVMHHIPTDREVPIMEAEQLLADLYAEGLISIADIENEMPFIVDQQDRNLQYRIEYGT